MADSDANWVYVTVASDDPNSIYAALPTQLPYSFRNNLAQPVRFPPEARVQVALFSLSFTYTLGAANETTFDVDSNVVSQGIAGSQLVNTLRRFTVDDPWATLPQTWTPNMLQWMPAVANDITDIELVISRITALTTDATEFTTPTHATLVFRAVYD